MQAYPHQKTSYIEPLSSTSVVTITLSVKHRVGVTSVAVTSVAVTSVAESESESETEGLLTEER